MYPPKINEIMHKFTIITLKAVIEEWNVEINYFT